MDPEILDACEIRKYKKGDVILRQDDEADGMYVIKSGKVEVEMDGKKIATLKKGDLFGEMGLMLHAPRNATITVISENLCVHFLSKGFFDGVKTEVRQEVLEKLFERTIENCDR